METENCIVLSFTDKKYFISEEKTDVLAELMNAASQEQIANEQIILQTTDRVPDLQWPADIALKRWLEVNSFKIEPVSSEE